MQNIQTKNTQHIIGILLIVLSIPGIGYSLIVSLGGGIFFLFTLLAFWLYWVPSLIALILGLKLYWGSKK